MTTYNNLDEKENIIENLRKYKKSILEEKHNNFQYTWDNEPKIKEKVSISSTLIKINQQIKIFEHYFLFL